MKRASLPWTTVFTDDDTSEVFLPATSWMSAAEVENIRFVWEQRGQTGLIQVRPGYEVADVENNPTNNYGVGTANSNNQVNYGTVTAVSANTDDKQLLRFGWMVQLSASGSLACTRVGGTVMIFTRC